MLYLAAHDASTRLQHVVVVAHAIFLCSDIALSCSVEAHSRQVCSTTTAVAPVLSCRRHDLRCRLQSCKGFA